MAAKYESRPDGGQNYDDRNGKSWVFYPPGTVPTRDVMKREGMLPVPGSTKIEMWPRTGLWQGGLRLPAYGQKAWTVLVTADSLDKLANQAEMFSEGFDLSVNAGLEFPWMALLVLGGLAYLSDRGKF